jgi:hypothetical protein
MAGSKKKAKKTSNLKPIPGYPGLYTFIAITRDPKKEKIFLEKVMRDAEKLRIERLAREALFLPRR